jgi:protein-S-isoprenylcysteine O-methyltransferase Ste14
VFASAVLLFPGAVHLRQASLGHIMPSLNHKIPPPLVGALVGLAMWFAASIGPAWAFSAAARNTAVAILVVAGLTFDVLGLLAFRASRTTVNPLKPQRASALVTRGVYRVTRNPMYVGMCCLLLAWAVYLSALLPFAGPAVFVLYMTRFQIQPEEQVLGQLFGEQYLQYTARVRRWL